jgi:heat shock protein HslJ
VRRLVVLLALPAVLLTTCSEDPGELTGATWVLDPATIATSMGLQVPAGTRVDITFADGTASGTAGCNTYSATYRAEGADLTFEQIVATTRACDEPLMDLEQRYLEILAATDSFDVDDDGATLVLSGGATPLGYTAEGREPVRD